MLGEASSKVLGISTPFSLSHGSRLYLFQSAIGRNSIVVLKILAFKTIIYLLAKAMRNEYAPEVCRFLCSCS